MTDLETARSDVRMLRQQVGILRRALAGVMSWHLADSHYVRMGFAKGGATVAFAVATDAMALTK